MKTNKLWKDVYNPVEEVKPSLTIHGNGSVMFINDNVNYGTVSLDVSSGEDSAVVGYYHGDVSGGYTVASDGGYTVAPLGGF